MLSTLERIADYGASYTMHLGIVNSTATTAGTPIPATTSGPSANNILVNVLWFASLMISLIAASFAILVKQWLREYLAVQNPSPQARLRVRHLREPQLAAWRVIEIAAVLPLLLQLSLGLFFVGMCYFTSEIHSSIGHTTIPLVAGWAACFLSVTLLPFIFPRCPYRTPLLKGIVRSWHRRFYKDTDREEEEVYVMALSTSSEQISGAQAAVRTAWRQFARLYARWQKHIQTYDEAKAAVTGEVDVEILTSVDLIQSNDELFRTTILEAFRQTHPSAEQLQQFIFIALKSRVQLPESAWTDELPEMDLSVLSASPRDTLIDLIVQHLTRTSGESHNGSIRSAPGAFIAVLIFLHGASKGQELSQSGIQFIRKDMGATSMSLVKAAEREGYGINEKLERILHFMLGLNIEVFGTMVLNIAQQIEPDQDHLQRFIYSALRSRVELHKDAWTDALPVMDLDNLAAAPRIAMIELIAHHLESRNWWRRGFGCSDRTAFIAVLMYLRNAPREQDLSQIGVQFMRQLLYQDGEDTCQTLVVAAGRSGDLDRKVQHILRTMWELVYDIGHDLSACVSNVRTIVDTYARFVRRDGDAFRIANEPIDPPPNLSRYPFDYVSDDCRWVTTKYLLHSLQFTFENWPSDPPLQVSTVRDALTLCLQSSYRPATGLKLPNWDLVGVFHIAWQNIESTRYLVSSIACLPLEYICDEYFRDCLTNSAGTVPLLIIRYSAHNAISDFTRNGSQELHYDGNVAYSRGGGIDARNVEDLSGGHLHDPAR